MTTTVVTDVLAEAGVGFELLPHPTTESATGEAEALGLSPGEVAKTLVVATPVGYVRALLPASERIDLRKVRALLEGGKRIHLATEEDLARDYPEFALGAVPPLAGVRRESVLLDRQLAERDSIVFEAGSHTESVRMRTADFLGLTGAKVVDICQE